jgi:hypothetical protein
MEKRKTLIALVVATFLAASLLGCGNISQFSYSDGLGEWDFPSVTFNSSPIGAVHLSVMGTDSAAMLDISWNSGSSFYMGDGTVSGNKFTGTYCSNSDLATRYNFTVTFSLSSGKLKASFSGDGPLDGLALANGVKAP